MQRKSATSKGDTWDHSASDDLGGSRSVRSTNSPESALHGNPLDCGLDVAYFSRLFRKHHGVLPRDFRRRSQSPPV